MSFSKLSLVASVAAALIVACSSEGGGVPSSPAPAPNTQKAATPTSAAAVLARGDHYAFALAESPQAAEGMRKRCATETNPSACFKSICEEVTSEQVRFEGTADALVFVSYELESKGEHVFERLPVAVTSDDGSALQMASKDGRYNVRVQLLGDGVVAMDDAKKGRLVFHRTP